MSQERKHFYEVDCFRIDVNQRVLFRNDEIIPLTRGAFDLLLALVERRGEVVAKGNY